MREVNKAAKIRELLAAGKSINEIATELKSIGVTASYAYSVKWHDDKAKAKKPRAGRKAKKPVKDSPPHETVNSESSVVKRETSYSPRTLDDKEIKPYLLRAEYIGFLRGSALHHLSKAGSSGQFANDVFTAASYLITLLDYIGDVNEELVSENTTEEMK